MEERMKFLARGGDRGIARKKKIREIARARARDRSRLSFTHIKGASRRIFSSCPSHSHVLRTTLNSLIYFIAL